jgi:hypothetical protein
MSKRGLSRALFTACSDVGIPPQTVPNARI